MITLYPIFVKSSVNAAETSQCQTIDTFRISSLVIEFGLYVQIQKFREYI